MVYKTNISHLEFVGEIGFVNILEIIRGFKILFEDPQIPQITGSFDQKLVGSVFRFFGPTH